MNTRTIPRLRIISCLLVASLVVLTGCGSSSRSTEPTAVPSPTAVSTPAASASPHVATPEASPVLAPSPVLPSPEPTPVLTIPDTPEQHLAAEYLANEPGVYGFVVLAADGTPIASINSRTPFVTASLYKLIVMADIYQRIEMGTIGSDDLVPLESHTFIEGSDNYFTPDQVGSSFTVQEYLFAVGAYSSNVAARTLLSLTSPGALRNTALSIGMYDTYLFTYLGDVPSWPPEPGIDAPPEEVALAQAYLEGSTSLGPINITTPYDMAVYQLAMLNDTLISPWVSQQVALVLQEQAIRDRIPHYLDGDVFVINKPGNLIDAVNDVGVIYLPNGPRAVAILSEAVPNPDRATEVEQYLALIATGWVEYTPPAAFIGGETAPGTYRLRDHTARAG